jgi:hypothetical protein
LGGLAQGKKAVAMNLRSQAELQDDSGHNTRISFGPKFWLGLIGVSLGPALTVSLAALLGFMHLSDRVLIVETKQQIQIDSNAQQDAILEKVVATQQLVVQAIGKIEMQLGYLKEGQLTIENEIRESRKSLEAKK